MKHAIIKRIISLLVATTVMFCLAGNAFANTTAKKFSVDSIVSQYGGDQAEELRSLINKYIIVYEDSASQQRFLGLVAQKLAAGTPADHIMMMNILQVMEGFPEGSLPSGTEPSTRGNAGEIRANTGGIRPKIAVGDNHTVYLKHDGTVVTWGKYILDAESINDEDEEAAVNPTGQLMTIPNLTDVIDIAAGGGSALALKKDGTVWAWGVNTRGQLGDGTTTNRITPVQVKQDGEYLTNVTAIAMGPYNGAAIKSDGSVVTWGDGLSGQLGIGVQTTYYPSAIQVVDIGGNGCLNDITAIAIGEKHMIALKTNRTVVSWGNNGQGQLGNDSMANSSYPVQVIDYSGVGNLGGITKITAGNNHNLALAADGRIYAWGSNMSGQIGIGRELPFATTPEQVCNSNGTGTLENVTEISAGAEHSVAKQSNGKVYAWGECSFVDDTIETLHIPKEVNGSNNYGNGDNTDKKYISSKIHSGSDHLIVQMADGTVWGIGANDACQLADSFPDEATTTWYKIYTPTAFIIDVGASSMNSIALASNGTLYASGQNSVGQLGIGVDGKSISPAIVVDSSGTGVLDNIIAIHSGWYNTLAIKADGTLWAWGVNREGELGIGTTYDHSNKPVQVLGPNGSGFLQDVASVTTGDNYCVAVKSDGTVWAWGRNTYGQLGIGTTSNYSTTPVQVQGPNGNGYLQDVISVTTDGTCCRALKSDGTVWEWGGQYGVSGQYPHETTSAYLTYGDVVKISGNMLLLKNGTVWTTGSNTYGQLGIGAGTNESSNTYVQVKDVTGLGVLTDIIDIDGGVSTNAAVASDGSVYTWGSNLYGSCGDNSTTDRNIPVRASGLNNMGYLTGVSRIISGNGHFFAFLSTGELVGWGDNWYGTFGNGSNHDQYNYPVYVYNTGAIFADEYGDTIATAEEIELDRTVNGNLYSYRDNDYFTFVFDESLGAAIKVTSKDDNVMWELLNSQQQSVSNLYSNGWYGLATGQRYYLKISQTRSTPSDYSLHINTVDDNFGNSFSEAYTVENNKTITGCLHSSSDSSDSDYFSFSAGNYIGVFIDITADNSIIHALYKKDDQDNYQQVSSGANGYHLLEPSKQYYIKISPSYKALTNYTLQINLVSDSTGNTIENAFGFLLDTNAIRNQKVDSIDYVGDVDVFKINVSQSGEYYLSTTGNCDTFGTLKRADGTTIVSANTGGEGDNFSIAHTLNPGTDYYLEVKANNQTTGEYTLHIETPLAATIQ